MANYGIIRMGKFKISDVQGIQKHNQRQGKSKSNKDIDYDKSNLNYDFLNDGNIQYERKIKERIAEKVKRKPRANSVVLSEFVLTASPEYMNELSVDEQKRYFAAGTDFIQNKYGAENVMYAVVHNDEATPHLHVGITPITKDGRLSAKDIFNGKRAMVKLQDEFHRHMVDHGFEIERGQPSDRKNIPTAEFKKETLEKELNSLEEEIISKKDELTAFVEKVESDLVVPVKREMKTVEVPSGEKTLFGKEKTKTEEKPTENVIISRSDYKKMLAAAQDNEKLKLHIKNMLNTDTAKENKKIVQQNEQIKEKYNDLVQRFNSTIDDYNELAEENRSLKDRVSDLKAEIGLVYKSVKEFLKERTDGVRTFRRVFGELVSKVKEKTTGSEFERLHKREERRERNRGMER